LQNFRLSYPIDIPWERICVTEDMIDPKVCDDRLPAKWQTSMAVYKYQPDEEYQVYPKYKITFLRVTATITGYQPLDKEIQGEIKWDGVSINTIPGLTDLLNSYSPCHGAILQVAVGPDSKKSDIPLDQYPFFMDFEPKKRELYEIATDTREKQSRSIETLNIMKSAGSAQSMEVLDIDMGGGGGGASASYQGTGGGVNYTAGNGQWGTKRLNGEESMSTRSSDVGEEKRTGYSFTTHLSQMYHLLDSYHLGTNRAVFFIQPRPHTLEESSGFVRGPRPIDGIQEFFMIVAQPKEQENFCVSLRLDTSHLTKTPIMEYETKSEVTQMASVTAPYATVNDDKAEREALWRACFGECWDIYYQCYSTQKKDSVTYEAPPGYKIVNYDNLINESSHGATNVVLSSNNASLVIDVEAKGHVCYEDGGVCVDCPDELQKWSGSARRQLQVNLRSTTATKLIREEESLMITTRGLCCCSSEEITKPLDEYIVGHTRIPRELVISKEETTITSDDLESNQKDTGTTDKSNDQSDVLYLDRTEKDKPFNISNLNRKHAIQQANELSTFIKTECIKNLNNPYVKLQKFVDTDFFAKQLEYKIVQNKRGRERLNESIVGEVPKKLIPILEKYFKKNCREITRLDLLSLRGEVLSEILHMTPKDIQRIKLISLGVQFHKDQDRHLQKS